MCERMSKMNQISVVSEMDEHSKHDVDNLNEWNEDWINENEILEHTFHHNQEWAEFIVYKWVIDKMKQKHYFLNLTQDLFPLIKKTTTAERTIFLSLIFDSFG